VRGGYGGGRAEEVQPSSVPRVAASQIRTAFDDALVHDSGCPRLRLMGLHLLDLVVESVSEPSVGRALLQADPPRPPAARTQARGLAGNWGLTLSVTIHGSFILIIGKDDEKEEARRCDGGCEGSGEVRREVEVAEVNEPLVDGAPPPDADVDLRPLRKRLTGYLGYFNV
jgi:hypothetical protein